jgi:predicted signal transduction protein with EAL and GGDEF domain
VNFRAFGIGSTLLWLALMSTGSQVHAQEDMAASYQCGPQTSPNQSWDAQAPWLPLVAGQVPVQRRDWACWVRVTAPGTEDRLTASGPRSQGLLFADLHIQRVDITLYDGDMQPLGSANRMGRQDDAMVTAQQAYFRVDPATRYPLYARLQPVPGSVETPGVAKQIRVEWLSQMDALRQAQKSDLGNMAVVVFLVSTSLLALLFFLAMGKSDYGIYALYAVAQAITHFSKTGLPLMLETRNPMWLNSVLFQYLVSALSALLYARLGRFNQHSPRHAYLAYGVMLGFMALIPLHLWDAAQTAKLVYILLPLHFVVALSGNWRGWRQGERACGILLIGLAPIAAYWAIFFVYNLLLQQEMPVSLAVGSTLDQLRTLLLPIAFCLNLAYRTLTLQSESLRLLRHDGLTGLYNREGLRLQGDRLLKLGCRPLVAVINVKRFHAINELLGPHLGDRLLIEVGQRLRDAAQGLGPYHLARMHADQFCLLFESPVLPDTLDPLLQASFARPADIAGQLVDLTIVAGTCTPASGLTTVELMRNAEMALEAARQQQKSFLNYQPDMESSRRVDLSLLSQLKKAVENNELRLVLQPKVSVSDGSLVGAEALVRWEHPERGMIPPMEFVPFAEKTGRITDITHWMLAEAMRITHAWRRVGKPLKISVNLSTFDLTDASFTHKLERLLEQTQAIPTDLCFEITESAAIQDGNKAMALMHQLCRMGFSLSIDDFGTGYSSLAYLQEMPVSELKIDRAFVRHAHHSRSAEALLESIIVMGQKLGLSVVAEGAETGREWKLLEEMGCDIAQGWWVAKPMAPVALETWVEENIPFQRDALTR